MASYGAYTSNVTTHPRPTVKSPSGAMALVRSVTAGYWAVTAGVQRAWAQRYNSAGVTGTARSDKFSTRSPANSAPGQSWATGPAAVGNVLLFSDTGDRTGGLGNRWTAPRPGAEIAMIDAEEVGADDNTTTSATFSHHLTWAEQNPGLEGRMVRGRRPRTRLWHHAAYRAGGNAVLSSRQRRHWSCFETRRWTKYFQPDSDVLLLAVGGGGGGAPINVNLGLLTETDAVFAIAAQKSVTLGLLSETDALLALSAVRVLTLGLLAETDALLPMGGGLAGPINVTLGLLTETDTLLAAQATKQVALGLLTESDALLAATAQKAVALGLLSEADTVLAVAAVKRVALGLLTETDIAQAMTATKSVQLGLLQEVDVLLPFAGAAATAITRLRTIMGVGL